MAFTFLNYVLLYLIALFKIGFTNCPHENPHLKKWSDRTTWPKGKPSYNATVILENSVLLDESPPQLLSITIRRTGSLVWKPGFNITLRVNYISIEGRMDIGSADCLFTGKARIILTGKRVDSDLVHAIKSITVHPGGSLELHGERKLSWTKLDKTLKKAQPLFDHAGSLNANVEDHSWQNAIVVYVFRIDSETNLPIEKKFGHFGLEYKWQRTSKLYEFKAMMNGVQNSDIVMLAKQQFFTSRPEYRSFYEAFEKMAFGNVKGQSKLRKIAGNDAYAAVVYKDTTSRVTEVLTHYSRNSYIANAQITLWDKKLKFRASSRVIPDKNWDTRDSFKIIHVDQAYPKLNLIDDVTSWNAGDMVLLTSTDYDWSQAEEASIVGCQDCSSKQIRIDLETRYDHWGEILDNVDQRGEVAVLTRNIVIKGEMEEECYVQDPKSPGNCANFNYDTFGGNIKVLTNFASVHIEGVELANMGKQTDLGSYPIHFHMCNDSTGTYIRETSIHNSFARCITVHGTHNLQITDNVCYHVLGHAFFLEDGGEKHTLFDGNLAASVLKAKMIPSDVNPAAFWITNPLTNLTNCVAAGGEGTGIWYVYPEEPIGDSRGLGFMTRGEARHTAITLFHNNVVHSHSKTGLFIDHVLMNDSSSGYINRYMPKVDPFDESSPNKEVELHRLTAYKNSDANVWIRGGYFHLRQASLSDSPKGITFARSSPQNQFISDSVVIGDSANVGCATRYFFNGTWSEKKRSYPHPWDLHYPRTGFLFYDGPVYVNNVWFNNFKNTVDYKMGAIGFKRYNKFSSSAVSHVKSAMFGFEDKTCMANRVFDGDETDHGFGNLDGDRSATFKDVDGSVTGMANTQVLKPEQFYITPKCTTRTNWKLAFCPHDYGKLLVQVPKQDVGKTVPLMTRDDTWAEMIMTGEKSADFLVIQGGSYSYLLHWKNYTPREYYIFSDGFEKNKWVRFGICLPRGATFQLFTWAPYWMPTKADWISVSSIADLENDINDGKKYFHDTNNDIVYFKFVHMYERGPNDFEPCPGVHCPVVNINITASNYSDADCRTRFKATKTQIDLKTDNTIMKKVFPYPPNGVGAGSTKPFLNRARIDGEWDQWGEWSHCNESCGGGTRSRTRKCVSPAPSNGGQPCIGMAIETKSCNAQTCVKVDGKFSGWSEWAKCIQTAECQGVRKRTRTCSNPTPEHGGKYCSGATEIVKPCALC